MELNEKFMMLESLKTGGEPRSDQWDETHIKFIAKNSTCAVCGAKTELEVHHIYPFHYCKKAGRPDLELDERNLMTLCEDETKSEHHLLIGHLGWWQSYNPDVKADIVTFKNKSNEQIKNDLKWLKKKEKRPKPYDEMSESEKKAFREELDKKFPK